ncbi:MAG: hypothetical protein K2M94_04360 [Paramuribaculum sp.]|nr:hypothetical protein [Paramuribaculum sp.]
MRKSKAQKGYCGALRSAMLLILAVLVIGPVLLSADKPTAKARRAPSRNVIRPTVPDADRMQSDKVFLEHADRLHYNEQVDVPAEEQYQVLTGNVKFRKEGMYMYCDSAFFYDAINSVDAYGNVRMEQGDTLFVYADELDYDGVDEVAVLYAHPGKKVRLINRDVKLETDVFNYDMAEDFGYYEVGGTLTDKQNRLDSRIGEYYPQTKDAFFYHDVKLESHRPKDTLYIFTDTLEYNTDTHIANLISPSRVINSDGTIYSSLGTYNTDSGVADLYSRSTVVGNRGNTLTGDTLFYDRSRQYGEAFGHVIITDSARQSCVEGDYGYYDEARDSSFVTGRAVAKEYSKGDTLYLHGDSIIAYTDLSDSTKVTNVFHKVRFFRSDMQGFCDSLSVRERDSLMLMYRNPVVWSGQRQIFGPVINVHFNDSTVDWARLPEGGIVAEHIGEDCYNQLTGKDITAWFNDSTLRRAFASGNVELFVFPMENDSSYNKYAYVESSYMDAYFLPKTIDHVNFWPETTSKVVPLYLAKRNSYFLAKFRWYGDLRPLVPADIFVIPEGMIELIESAPPITAEQKNPTDKKKIGPHPDAPVEQGLGDELMTNEPDAVALAEDEPAIVGDESGQEAVAESGEDVTAPEGAQIEPPVVEHPEEMDAE